MKIKTAEYRWTCNFTLAGVIFNNTNEPFILIQKEFYMRSRWCQTSFYEMTSKGTNIGWQFHRDDGPALITPGKKVFYLHGKPK